MVYLYFRRIEGDHRVDGAFTAGAGDYLHAVFPAWKMFCRDKGVRTGYIPDCVGKGVGQGVDFHHTVGVVGHADTLQVDVETAESEAGRVLRGDHQLRVLVVPFGIQVDETVVFGGEIQNLLLIRKPHQSRVVRMQCPAQETVTFVQESVFGEELHLVIDELLIRHFSGRLLVVFVEPDFVSDGFPNGIEEIVRGDLVGSHTIRKVFVGVGRFDRVVVVAYGIVPQEIDGGVRINQVSRVGGFLS